jgi:hypothetical protein
MQATDALGAVTVVVADQDLQEAPSGGGFKKSGANILNAPLRR